ncbi:hypothetical protein NE865_02075 [Phthorimaea operculella]|nr:hypothetical protein NE865_02075 [Phthorimaea operculella]
MTTKSPTPVRSREIIGVDQFSQRREVFGKHDTVFLPSSPPSSPMAYSGTDVPPIITSNHGKTTTNFKRNAPTYSSMRESRTENIEFRARKYSDNFTSDLNQSDDVDYRSSMTERTRRLSKLRRDFLKSNLHDPNQDVPFARTGVRASMPVNSGSVTKYKIESPNLYKFPFAEPYATPPPARRVFVDLGPAEHNGQVNGEKENQDPAVKTRHQSLSANEFSPKVDHQKLFEELVKRYSPERKPVNWKLPPTRPRVVGSVPKSTSSAADSLDINDKNHTEDVVNKSGDDDVFIQRATISRETAEIELIHDEQNNNKEKPTQKDDSLNKPDSPEKKANVNSTNDNSNSRASLDEKNDQVPELSNLAKQNRELPKKVPHTDYTDMTIPALIEKMTEEGEDLESHKNDKKKVKRKRSFLDKLLGRKKEK